MQIEIIETLVTRGVPRDTYAPWLSPSADKVELFQDYVFRVTSKKHKVDAIIRIPKGYLSDWSTIPRPVWWIWPPNFTEARKGAVPHDYIYSHLYWYYTKEFADDLLLAFMKMENASRTSQWVFRRAVGIGGKGGWQYKDHPNAHPHWNTRHPLLSYDTGYSFLDEAVIAKT